MSARKPSCRSRLDRGGHFAGVPVACCRARNAGSTGSAWRPWDPELGGSGVAVGVASAREPACVFDRADGAIDLAGFPVATDRLQASVRLIPSWRSLASVQIRPRLGHRGCRRTSRRWLPGPKTRIYRKWTVSSAPPEDPVQNSRSPRRARCWPHGPDVTSTKQQPRRQRSRCGTRTNQPGRHGLTPARAGKRAPRRRVGRPHTSTR